MINIKVKIDPKLVKIASNFKNGRRVFEKHIDRGLKRIAVVIVKHAKVQVPVRTGFLRSTIEKSKYTKMTYIITAWAYYSHFVHWGTRYMNANPFFTRAIRNSKPEVRRIMRKASKDIIKELSK